MMFQFTFWVYIALFVDSSKSLGHQLPTRRNVQGPPIKVEHQQRPPGIIKPVSKIDKQVVDKEVNVKQVEGQEHPQGGYLTDLTEVIDEKADDNTRQVKAEVKESDYDKYYNPLLHHTLLHRDALVIWENSFVLNPKSICSRHSDLDLLVIVHTAPYNFKRRAMIRQHIANKHRTFPYTIQPVFMIGAVPGDRRNISHDAKVVDEYGTFGDLVKMDFVEDFRNLSLKAVMWLKWTNEHCKNANMILKIDDDVVIDIQKILPLSRGLFSKYKRSIFCHLNKIGSQPIPRRGRTEVDPREFMRMLYYPYTYCSGFIVFLTPDIIPHLEETARKIPFYNVDDVYMFGMVPKFAGGVTYHNIGFNVSIWNPKVLRCQQNRGLMCPYFGTMGEEEEDRLNVWNAMKHNHDFDFHFPQMVVGH